MSYILAATDGKLMHDGPILCSSLSRKWSRVADRAAKPSYSVQEISEALIEALLEDGRALPLEEIKALPSQNRRIPFESTGEQVDEILEFLQESGLAGAIKRQFRGGLTTDGHDMVRLKPLFAVGLKEHARAKVRQICAEMRGQRTHSLCVRLRSAVVGCDYAKVAQSILSPAFNQSSPRLVLRDGIDDGPQLPEPGGAA